MTTVAASPSTGTVALPPAVFTSLAKSEATCCSKVSWKLEPPPSILAEASARAFVSTLAVVAGESDEPDAFVVVEDDLEAELPQAEASNESTATTAISQAELRRFFKGEPSLGVRVHLSEQTVKSPGCPPGRPR